MKKIILLPLFLIGFLFNMTVSFGQCVPDPNCTDPDGDGEYCPTQFPDAIEDEYYEEVLTIISPTIIQGITIHHIDLISLTNIPPGMSYECQDSDCSFWPGIAKCVSVYGTPAVDSWGTYNLHIQIEAFMDVAGFPVSMGIITDSSSTVTIQPQLHADFNIDFEVSNYVCLNRPYTVSYEGNATENATYNWDFGDNLEVLSGEGQGPYQIIYTDYFGMDSISLEVQEGIYTSPVFTEEYIVDICEGTLEDELFSLSVQPNPFTDYIEINHTLNQNTEVFIHDISGKIVFQSQQINQNSERINLSALEKGVYFLSIRNSKSVVTKKIMKY